MSSKQQTPDAPQKGRTAAKKPPKDATRNQATVDEFDRAGLGVAPKE